MATTAIINGDLDLLDDEHDSGDILVVVPEVGLAEQVVHVPVATVLLLVDDEDFIDLLHDGLLAAIVDDLEVLLLDLNDLLLLVEVVEAVDEVEGITAVSSAKAVVVALGVGRQLLWGVDWLSNYRSC